MPDIQLSEAATAWVNDVLVWVGFGTLVGLAARAIMPGRDPGGAIATLAMGIGGTIFGCGGLMYFRNGERVTPISPMGFLVATVGAFAILLLYRILGGYYFKESDGGLAHLSRFRSARRVHQSRYYDN